MKQLLWLSASVLAVAACTEQLVTPGGCPELCPGGEAVVFDTFLTPVTGGDSAFSGYSDITNTVRMPISNGGVLGESRAVIRFIPRGDSVIVTDTGRSFTVDSAIVSFVLQSRDSTIGGLSMDLYRLPHHIDSDASFADIDAAMTPQSLLRSLSVPDDLRSDRYPVAFSGADLDKLSFPAEDSSTALVVGIRLRGPTGAGAYISGAASGSGTGLLVTYVDVGLADTALQKQVIQRGVAQNFSVSDGDPLSTVDLLAVGGKSAARSTIRFELSPFLRDSATILRATLELVSDTPPVGIAGDSVQVVTRVVLANLGAKSPVVIDPSSALWVRPGVDTVMIELANFASFWQGEQAIDPAVRISLQNEHASFMQLLFNSTRSGSGQPRLRVTYRPPFALEGL